ncbi:hypothetical protein MAC_08369 [Metarhizium acridum CQMa 102]|uniref:Uncharacterized protein n=1 Tax=Metarhizium acridum (strain CQMa 102) TaxID=655827 RepID=E9EES1_METAQ|nr:uncharacterized protein MAC_08369 [Metarhizium acridum CQMa 102]EFY85589.1 hypothetical protein MAC_08369 [Metarhizium acridum CQMa 102]
MAYQPCCKDIDLMGFFKPLKPIEPGVDRLFKVARAWSCIIQSLENLPKDLRWVLATVYNFANDMLCAKLSEDTMWRMRPWLMYWYDVADALLELFNISASAPVPDWFFRPGADNSDEEEEPEDGVMVTLCRTNSVTSDGNLTVLRHDTSGRKIQQVRDISSGHQSGIRAWIDAQPDWGAERQCINPNPGEGVWGNRVASSPPPSTQSEVSRQVTFHFNPEAMEFDPHLNLTTSPASVSSRSSSTWSIEPTATLVDYESTSEASRLSATTFSCDSLEQILTPLRAVTPPPLGG